MASKLNELHAQYYERLLSIAKRLRKGAPWMDPGDLLQEALLRLLTRPQNVVDRMRDKPADGWLIQIMVNLVCDENRKRMSRQKGQEDPTITRWTLGEGGASATYEKITPERFKWAIEQLPEKQRLTFLLHCEGLRNQEIARKLGISPQAVAKRLFDARENLKRLLQPYVDEETLQ